MNTTTPMIAPGDPLPEVANGSHSGAFNSTVQLLALCPLLAVSDTVVKAFGFSAVVLIVVPLSTLLLQLIRRLLDDDIVLPASLLITAGLTTASELVLRAWFYDLGASLDVFLPLLAVNVILVDHIQIAHASKRAALSRSVRISCGIAVTLLALGVARELVGRGSLLNGAGSMLAPWAGRFEVNVFSLDMGFLLALLPPGAFISLGLLIAARNWLTHRNA